MPTAAFVRKGSLAALVVGMVAGAVTGAAAADPLSVGAQTAWGTQTHLGLGGQLVWGDRPALALGVGRWLPTARAGLRTARWEADVSATFRLRARARAVRPYLGAGVSLIRTEGEETLVPWNVSAVQWSRGVNVLAGVEVRAARRYSAYAELRGQFWSTRQIAATSGVRLAFVR